MVRDARAEDLDEASAMMVAAYRQYFPENPDEIWRAYAREIADVRSRLGVAELIVAERAGRIAGAVTFFPDGSLAEADGWPERWSGIRLLAVDPAARGGGIGRLLTDECIRRSRARGCVAVGLHTTDFMDVAMGMYERLGFRRAPELDFVPTEGVLAKAYRLEL